MYAALFNLGDEQSFKVYYSSPRALLPVATSKGGVQFFPWGRRKDQAGNLPMGGWARLSSIQEGQWQAYFPKPVKLPVAKFMEKDFENKACWFDITDGHYVQGLLARYDQEVRVYVVTIQPQRKDALFERWPRII